MPERNFDTDEFEAIKDMIEKAPSYFEKTDLMYRVLITGDPVNGHPSLISMMQETQKKVEALYKLGWMIAGSVISVMVAAVVSGVLILVRLAPIIAELELLARQKP